MTVAITDRFKSVPTISADKFVAVLESVGSFDADALWEPTPRDKRPAKAREAYQTIVDGGHDPGRWLGIAGKEHTWATNKASVIWRNTTRSWTNARSIQHPGVLNRTRKQFEHDARVDGIGTIHDASRNSRYAIYVDVIDSLIDGMYRIDDPGYSYKDAVSIVEVISIFAPGSDGNYPIQYAETMCDWLNGWIATDPTKPPMQEEDPPMANPISGLKDIRHRLHTSADGNRGPLRTIPRSQKRGVVIHFRGVNTNPAPGYDSFAADATYHVNKDWGQGSQGDGIMYHIGIGWDAVKYQMRDLDRVLWHCGETNRNENSLAIQLPMGADQHATPEMLKALKEVVDEWLAFTGAPRSDVWGHEEVTPTNCPGTLMDSFVKPYRAGKLGQPPVQPSPPDALIVPNNPFGPVPLIAGFRGVFERVGAANFPDDPIAGAVAVLGYAEAPEYETEFGSAQVCQRVVLKWFRGTKAPWDLVVALRTEGIPERKPA